jgi:hypothetical protein
MAGQYEPKWHSSKRDRGLSVCPQMFWGRASRPRLPLIRALPLRLPLVSALPLLAPEGSDMTDWPTIGDSSGTPMGRSVVSLGEAPPTMRSRGECNALADGSTLPPIGCAEASASSSCTSTSHVGSSVTVGGRSSSSSFESMVSSPWSSPRLLPKVFLPLILLGLSLCLVCRVIRRSLGHRP